MSFRCMIGICTAVHHHYCRSHIFWGNKRGRATLLRSTCCRLRISRSWCGLKPTGELTMFPKLVKTLLLDYLAPRFQFAELPFKAAFHLWLVSINLWPHPSNSATWSSWDSVLICEWSTLFSLSLFPPLVQQHIQTGFWWERINIRLPVELL